MHHTTNLPFETLAARALFLTMPKHIFSCSHPISRNSPCPRDVSYPPPAVLLFPCRSCAHTLCRSAANDIKADYDPQIINWNSRIKEAGRRLTEEGWDKYMQQAWNAAKEKRDNLEREKAKQLDDCWGQFETRWGYGRGNGKKWRDEAYS